jgi:hypothetical protein
MSTTNSPLQVWAGENGIEDSKIHSEFIHRLVAGRDMHVIITASSETGVGKTTLAFALAVLWDQAGWHVGKASVADPSKYSRLYDDDEQVPPGSVLILDEAEKAVDARRGMSSESVELSQDFASKRYRQIFGILTAPSKGWVDKRLGSDSADYWIQAQETDTGKPKGEAVVYRLKTNEHYEREYSKREEVISWPILDSHPEFERLNRIKEEELEGSDEDKYIHRDEIEGIKKEAYKEGVRDGEASILSGIVENTDLRYSDLAEATHLAQGTISNRVNED